MVISGRIYIIGYLDCQFYCPPLRDRDNDVIIIAKFFLKEFCKENDISELKFSKKAQDKARLAESLYKERKRSISEICNHLDISKPTLYRYLRERGVTIGN